MIVNFFFFKNEVIAGVCIIVFVLNYVLGIFFVMLFILCYLT